VRLSPGSGWTTNVARAYYPAIRRRRNSIGTDRYRPLQDVHGSQRIDRPLSVVSHELVRILRREDYVVQQQWKVPIDARGQSMPGLHEIVAAQPAWLGKRWDVGALGPQRRDPRLAFWLTGEVEGGSCLLRWHAGRTGEGTPQVERWNWWMEQLVLRLRGDAG
jgi:hypothetical protein